ncbi:MAG: NADH:ubiquinone oxidoreductase [Actinobacteria bacterium]|nr:NADH:ubiquinone oxidoreductase [Actinomycetota bacterium]
MSRPKIGVFGLAGCGGCQLEILNLEEHLIDFIKAVDIVHFTEAITEHSDTYEIALIEGSVSTEHDRERLEHIASVAKTVVAVGACACTGGLNCLKNIYGLERAKELVYGDRKDWIDAIETMPIDRIVKVDHYARGCPPTRSEIVDIVRSLIAGKIPEISSYPVCIECKRLGNTCIYEFGVTCLGPVARAGCNARCPSAGAGCEACRGPIDEPNVNAQKDLLQKYGLTVEDVMEGFNLYNACKKIEQKNS